MKKIINKILAAALIIMLCFGFSVNNAEAANVSVSVGLSASQVSIGKTVTATIKVSGSSISAYTMYITYDASVLKFSSGSGATINGGGGTLTVCGTSSGTLTVKFTALANGTSSVKTSGSEFYDINYSTLSVSHGSSRVTVATESTTAKPTTEATTAKSTTEATTQSGTQTTTAKPTTEATTQATTEVPTDEDNRSTNCYLKSLRVSPGTLSPSFSKGNKNYVIELDKDATSIVVSAEAEDQLAQVTVSGAKNLKPGANTVKITVTAENGTVKVYKITVNCGPVLGDAKANINGEYYDIVNDESILEAPEGFEGTTVQYNEWEVLAYKSANQKVTIIALSDAESNISWYILNADGSLTPYIEYSAEFNRYIIMDFPEGIEIPAGYEKTTLNILGNTVDAYITENSAGIYLIYAMNVSSDEGLYLYDSVEMNFMRYIEKEAEEIVTEAVATDPEPTTEATTAAPKKKSVISNDTLKLVVVIISLLFLISIMLIAIMGAKISSLKSGDDDDDEDEEVDDFTEEDTIDKGDFANNESSDNQEYEIPDVNASEDLAAADFIDNVANNSVFTDANAFEEESVFTDASAFEEDSAFGIEEKSAFEEAPEENGFILSEKGDFVESEYIPEEQTSNTMDSAFEKPYIDSAFDVVEVDYVPEPLQDIPVPRAVSEEVPYVEDTSVSVPEDTAFVDVPLIQAETLQSEPIQDEASVSEEVVQSEISVPEATIQEVKTVPVVEPVIPAESVQVEEPAQAGPRIELPAEFDDWD